MSVRLEQGGLYILPDALAGASYLILQAQQTTGGWQLVECHATPFGSDRFKARAVASDEQVIRFDVDASGALAQRGGDETQPRRFTLANLSLIGYLRDGQFIPTEEGL
ncbi:MAG TPA: hypothetical protein VFZ66_24530 [Herpetosiphonaceae bacterium]